MTVNSSISSSIDKSSSSKQTTEALSTKIPEIRWDHSPQEIEKITNDLLKESDQRINSII
jgi:Zn-dependent oligopeptidase